MPSRNIASVRDYLRQLPRDIFRGTAEVLQRLSEEPRESLVLTATLLYVVFYPKGSDLVRTSFLVFGGFGLLAPALKTNRWMWFGIFLASLFRLTWRADNHWYLFSWWILAVFVALGHPSSSAIIRRSARLLLGLAFFFATLWKLVLSADYMSGDFFLATLLDDGRFSEVSLRVAGVPASILNHAAHSLDLVRAGAERSVAVPIPSRLFILAQLMTWWTVIIEGALGILYLIPAPAASRVGQIRDWILLAFIWTTYLVATVIGFGWILVILGLAQLDDHRDGAGLGWRRLAFLASFVVILVYSVVPVVTLVGEQLVDDDSQVDRVWQTDPLGTPNPATHEPTAGAGS